MRWAKPSRLMRPYIERLLEMAEQTASLAASILLIASHDPAAPRSKPLLVGYVQALVGVEPPGQSSGVRAAVSQG
jgi:hypothetical protein